MGVLIYPGQKPLESGTLSCGTNPEVGLGIRYQSPPGIWWRPVQTAAYFIQILLPITGGEQDCDILKALDPRIS
jgi:hypothetical protein